MIRVIIVDVDANAAANVGGPVHTTYRTFEVDAPELEAFMAEPETWTGSVRSLCQRSIVGVEVVNPTHSPTVSAPE